MLTVRRRQGTQGSQVPNLGEAPGEGLRDAEGNLQHA